MISIFQQTPARRQFIASNHPHRGQIISFASHAEVGFLPKRLFAISEKIRAGNLALDQNRVAGALPADSVGHFTAGAGLLREDDAAAIGA